MFSVEWNYWHAAAMIGSSQNRFWHLVTLSLDISETMQYTC